ncbi:MAG: hypothetical protein VST67_01100 [Nitrospirota bacterium]|nr:hypothetical protein [Nitrospirota bacterium]
MRININLFQHPWAKWMQILLCTMGWLLLLNTLVLANHRGSEGHSMMEASDTEDVTGHAVPGAPFRVFLAKSKVLVENNALTKTKANETIQTVIDAFSKMVKHRTTYKRFDEALAMGALQKVIIEPKVFNRDGKEFMFLVARTKQKWQVKLLINASALREKGFVNHPEKLVPVLAREFQWVVSKADTTKKRKTVLVKRDLTKSPLHTNSEIRNLSGIEREQNLQALFRTYLTTVDNFESLKGQPYYDFGAITKVQPTQSDSTLHFYDIRVREALQHIVRESYFLEHTPKAVRSLLNGKIWNVAFAHIDSRDWATRTRVLPKDKAVKVGEKEKVIQPAKVLINLHRKAAPDDPYFSLTDDLPMGALSTDQLAQVIALEIENQIIEKSMRGHVAEDARTVPK